MTEPKSPAPDQEGGATPSALPALDVVLVHGVTPDGRGLQVIRHRKDRFEVGAVHALREGQPIHGELVRLKPREGCPLLCDVEVTLPAPASTEATDVAAQPDAAPRRGPAQVASARYRANWDAIWPGQGEEELPN